MAIGTATAMLGSAVIGGFAQNRASNAATGAMTDAQARADEITAANGRDARRAINQGSRGAADAIRGGQRGQVEALRNGYQQQRNMLNPQIQSGQMASDVRNFRLGLGDRPDDYNGMRQTNAYKFRFNEAMQGVNDGAAATGSLFSGNTAEALQNRAFGLADQFETQYDNRLAGIAQQGNNATNMLAGLRGNLGTNIANIRGNTAGSIANIRNQRGVAIGNNLIGQGNALANGAIGAGNARAAGSIASGNSLTNMLTNSVGAMGYGMQNGGFGGGDKSAQKDVGGWWTR